MPTLKDIGAALKWLARPIGWARDSFLKERQLKEGAFTKRRDILKERLARATDPIDIATVETELRQAEDDELQYHTRQAGIVAKSIVEDRAPTELLMSDTPTLPAPEQRALGRAAVAWAVADENPTVQSHNKRGNAFFAAGELKRAREEFNEAIRLDPKDSKTHFYRGLANAALGDNRAAIADYNAAYPFDFAFSTNAYRYNICIRDSSTYQEAVGWFDRMRADRVKPDIYTYSTLMSKADDYPTAKGWYDVMVADRIEPNVVTYSTLMNKAEDYPTAKGWHDVMVAAGIEPNVVTYNTLMSKAEDYPTAKGWHDVMVAAGIEPNVVTYNTLMSKADDYPTAKGSHDVMVAAGVDTNEYTYNTLFSKDLSQVDADELVEWYLAQPYHPEMPIQAMIKSFKRAWQHDKVARVVLHYPYLPAARKVFQEHPEVCIEYFESLLALEPSHPNASYALGIALIDSGRGQEAVPHLREALLQAEKREVGGKRSTYIRSLITAVDP